MDQKELIETVLSDETEASKFKMIVYHELGGGGHMAIPTKYGIMEGRADEIRERIRQASANEEQQEDMSNPYNHDMEMCSSETVNGFLLRNQQRPLMPEDLYQELVDLWKSESGPNSERQGVSNNYLSFINQCTYLMCTDWNKMDEYGEPYSGYWKYPKGSYESENAYYLSKKMNIYCLYKLPYPLNILLKTIELGCTNRQESVLYSNFLCEWVRRKYHQLNPDLDQLPLRLPKDVNPPHNKGSQDWKNMPQSL